MTEARKELQLKQKDKIILFFGSINPRKGAEKIVTAWDKLIEKQDNVTLVMAGNVDYAKGYLENIAQRKRISDHVKIFRGWVPNDKVHFFFTAADMVILPYNEGFTSGILKLAYAFKKPVIASSVGELSDVITSEKTGIILDDFFSGKTALCVIKTLNSAEQLDQFRKNIEKIDKEKYSWNAIAQKTALAYLKKFNCT
ncbi:MAG: glycosyltransferase family 4 protein [bacterium]|nr:glycosyltransferase family 4 protein [bacterium]